MQYFIEKCGFAGTTHASDAHEFAQRHICVYVFEVVLGCAAYLYLAFIGRATSIGNVDSRLLAQIRECA